MCPILGKGTSSSRTVARPICANIITRTWRARSWGTPWRSRNARFTVAKGICVMGEHQMRPAVLLVRLRFRISVGANNPIGWLIVYLTKRWWLIFGARRHFVMGLVAAPAHNSIPGIAPVTKWRGMQMSTRLLVTHYVNPRRTVWSDSTSIVPSATREPSAKPRRVWTLIYHDLRHRVKICRWLTRMRPVSPQHFDHVTNVMT